MPVNQTLAQFSDWSYFTAFGLYLVALLFFIGHYVRRQFAIEAEREAALTESADEKVLVGAGASNANAADNVDATDSVATGTSSSSVSTREAQSEKAEKYSKVARRWGNMGELVLFLGIAVHFASVVLRGLATSRFPWGNLYEYIALTLLFAMIMAAALLHQEKMKVFWPWLLTPVAALMFYGGTSLYAESAPVVPALKSNWFIIHVSTVSGGGSILLVSGIASLLYLLRIAQPKGKEKGFFGKVVMPLPEAKTLDAIAYRTAILGFPLFGLGIVLGAIWAEVAWGRFWGWDPKETVSLITWMIYAAYLHARATSGWRNHKAAWINILGFATMVFNLFFINMVVSGLHSYAGLN
ncbi:MULTISPECIES: c-type cytochrome biogenesis protein CcsB [unclassified Corynebacterium]|uniref:c-type cytochrome biogenesis protein CcsB n=1 Tax=unclassified Corynebacterium TaxID=2624378 RepID=UPI0030AD0D7A